MRISDWSSDVCSSDLDATAARMRCTPIADWYRALNTPAARDRLNRIYYDYALIGDGETDPGAVWVGNWYTRNLRIFGHLVRLAKPDDRVLVLYGAGHGFLLDQDARQSGAFDVVDPLRSEEHTSELQSLMRISYAVFCLKNKTN